MMGITAMMYQASNQHLLLTPMKLYKYKEKFVILQSIGIIVTKRKETWVVTYTCKILVGIYM